MKSFSTPMESPSPLLLPMAGSSVSAGFPSPADDFVENAIDLNELLITHPAATFFVRVKGDSMLQAGIFDQDVLVVDRSLAPRHKDIVIASIEGDFTCKYFIKRESKVFLYPANPKYRPIPVSRDSDLVIWGVVTYVISKKRI